MRPTPTPRTYLRRRVRRGAKCTAWCHKHKLNERALQRVARVRSQLERHMRRLGLGFGLGIGIGLGLGFGFGLGLGLALTLTEP